MIIQQLLNKFRHMTSRRSSVIPASWREYSKSSLDTRQRGYDETAPTRTLESRSFQSEYLPAFIEKLRHAFRPLPIGIPSTRSRQEDRVVIWSAE